MRFREKILAPASLLRWREECRAAGRRLVATNGCFDILHLGHVTYLEEARSFGDELLVGINGDESVRAIKGPGRPINSESDRAAVVAALACVSGVFIFQDHDALKFLEMVQPEIYVKGGDYKLDTINQEERALVEKMGGQVRVVAGVPGKSTTGLLGKLREP